MAGDILQMCKRLASRETTCTSQKVDAAGDATSIWPDIQRRSVDMQLIAAVAYEWRLLPFWLHSHCSTERLHKPRDVSTADLTKSNNAAAQARKQNLDSIYNVC